MNNVMRFAKWGGENGLEQFILALTGCKPFNGAGINYRKTRKTTILKSVDNTYYYDDNLTDPNNVEYTLFGHDGDQTEAEPRFNEPLLNPEKSEHIYLYRVSPLGRGQEYLWYGKYEIVGQVTRANQGKDHIMRNIIVLSLRKID
jgi:hypothetical protein